MSVKEHYDNHLGNFYAWMSGNFTQRTKEFSSFLKENNIRPVGSRLAVDLGAGHGIQSVALSKAGFTVEAIDFNNQLIKQLHKKAEKLDIHVIKDDLRNFKNYCTRQPQVIVCWGDTLTHLENKTEIGQLLRSIYQSLEPGGRLLLSFRDYSQALLGLDRFIPVKSDDKRILTCFLEYFENTVVVTDILHEKKSDGWQQKISSYNKVRLDPAQVSELLRSLGFNLLLNIKKNGLVKMIAQKQGK